MVSGFTGGRGPGAPCSLRWLLVARWSSRPRGLRPSRRASRLAQERGRGAPCEGSRPAARANGGGLLCVAQTGGCGVFLSLSLSAPPITSLHHLPHHPPPHTHTPHGGLRASELSPCLAAPLGSSATEGPVLPRPGRPRFPSGKFCDAEISGRIGRAGAEGGVGRPGPLRAQLRRPRW